MAKLIRCPAGHVYDSQAHEACPECARTGVPRAEEDARPARVGKAAQATEEDSGKGGGETKRGMPLTWLIGGGAAVALLIAAAIFLPRPSGTDPKSDADYGACEKTAGDSSIAACDRAIASGKFAGADLGALYRYRGYTKSNAEKADLDAALADYGEAVRLEPNSFIPFILRANVYADKGEQDLAIKDYDRAIELNPRADFYNNRGNSLRKTRAFDRAIADLDQAIKLEPNHVSAYWNRGLAYQDKGDKDKAAEDYKKALSLNPSDSAKKLIEALLKVVTAEPASQTATPTQATPPQQAGAASTDTGKDKGPESAPNSKVLKSVEQVVADPDYKACEALGSHKLADCDRAIASGKFEGAALAVLYNNRSNARSRNHDNDGALQDLEKAIEINPNSAPAHSNRGVIYANRKEYDRAIADFDKAIEIDATKPFPFQGRGLSYWKKGDLERAAADYKKALTLNPQPQFKEQIERELKEIEAAATSTPGSEPAQKHADAANDTSNGKEPEPAPSSKVLKTPEEVFADPDFKACRSLGTNQAADCDRAIASGKFEGLPLAALYNNRGQARGMNKDDDRALEDFNKALELNPNADAAYNNRGTIFSERGEYDRAIADFDKAIELNATQPIIFHGRGLAYWRKGELERAAQDYKKALSLNPPGKLKESYEQELKEIEAGAKPTPGPAPAQKQGNVDDSGTDKGNAPEPSAQTAEANTDPEADYQTCQSLSGDFRSACDRAVASGKFIGSALVALHISRAAARAAYDDNTGAIADYTEAIRLAPDNWDAIYSRGTLYRETGDYDRAIEDYNTYIKQFPTYAFLFNDRGLAYAAKDNYARAIADFGRAIELDPTDSKAYKNRGDVYRKKGDAALATADYKKALSLDPSDTVRKETEQALKEIEAGGTSTPGSRPAQNQGSAGTPVDDKNSALSAVREGGSGDGSGLPSTATPPEGQGSSPSLLPKHGATPLPAIPDGVATSPLPGIYLLKGADSKGRGYSGMATLTNDGKKFHLKVYSDDDFFRGTGQFKGGVLKMRYSGNTTVNFNLKNDGSLDGKWGKGGSERLEPFAFTAATDMPLAEGVYRIAGRQSDGKSTSGSVRVTKSGDLYHLAWTYDDGDKFEGRGSFADNILVLKGSDNGWDSDAAIIYALAADGSLTGLYASGQGQEKLTPAGAISSADNAPQSKPDPAADPNKDGTKAQPPKSGPWAAIAADSKGRWGDAVGQPSREAAENAALEGCGSGCKVIGDRALKGSCLAYAESRQGGYWYFAWIGPNESNVQSNALNGCNKAAPAGSCKLVKSICAPAPGSVPQASANPSASQASADPKKDAESCMNTFGGDAMAACDRAIASGHFGKLDLGTLHNQRGVLHLMKLRDDDAIAEFSEAIRLDDSIAKYFNHRGYAYFAKGDYDKAIADFDQAIKRAPESPSGYKGRAQSYFKKGITGLARDDYNKALSLNPDADSRKQIEEALKELGPDVRNMKMQ